MLPQDGGVKPPLHTQIESRDRLGGDGVVAFEGFANIVGGDGAFAADAPLVATKLDDRGGHGAGGFAGIEDERDAIAELAEDFVAAFASGRSGEVGAGAGERNAKFGDEIGDDVAFGPAKSDATGVGSDLQGKAVGGVDDDRKRAGPASLGEPKEIIGEIFGEDRGVDEGIDENGKGAMFGTALDSENFLDGGEIDGIGGEGVERVRGDSDDSTPV